MSLIQVRLPPPQHEDVFEQMCLQLLRKFWSRPTLDTFGKRGERQYGIDILDLGGEMNIYAAQCKLKAEYKSLPPSEIEDEVTKAKTFSLPLAKYAILTTAKVSGQSQRKVQEINRIHKELGLFVVELFAWERICSILQQYPEVQEQFYDDFSSSRARSIEANVIAIKDGMQSLTSKFDGDAIDSEINEARDCITGREFQLATLMLNRIQLKFADKITPRQKFRLLSNHGAAALGLGKADVAAKYFLDAAQAQPDNEQSKINSVLAYFLVGDATECHSMASHLRSQYPASARLAALWINSAPKAVSFATAESEFNSVLRADPEVSIALARRALAELSFDDAAKYAELASIGAPKWSQPHLVLGQVNLGRSIRLQMGFDSKNAVQDSCLRTAEENFSSALNLSTAEKDDLTRAASLTLRAEVRLLLKKTDDANQDIEDAQKINSDDPSVSITTAQARFASGLTEEAIAILKRAYKASQRPDIAFMYGRALQSRGGDGDVRDALSAFLGIPIADIHQDLRPATVMHTIQCFVDAKEMAAADSFLAKISLSVDRCTLLVMRGYLCHHRGQPGEAEQFAVEAKSHFPSDGNAYTEQILARLLTLIGRPADALPLMQDLFNRRVPDFDPKHLLACAARLRRDDIVMRTCDELHSRGFNDWGLVEFESQYLERYDLDAAISRLQDFIERNSENKLAKIRLSLIGLRLNKTELVSAEAHDFPSVGELPLQYVGPAIHVMKHGGHPVEAVAYAYRYLRTHFTELEAHEALVAAMLPDAFAPDIPATLDVVTPDSAVRYIELPNGNSTWVVLDDTDKPVAEFEEVPLRSHLAIQLLGKKVGETFVLARGDLHVRHAKIIEIIPKYVRRYQDTTCEMQVRFGEASSIESIQVGESEDSNQSKGVEIILASLERRAAAAAGARAAYDNKPVSMHAFGALFGKDAYEGLISLAEQKGQQVRCCSGTQDDQAQAFQSLQTAKHLVVGATALATLRLLNLEKVLSSKRFRFVIPERTWVIFREKASEIRFSGLGGMLVHKDGIPVLYEESASDRQRRQQEFEEFVRLLDAATERRNCVRLAELDPVKRELLERYFGPYGAEAMVLASDPEVAFWTDDLVEAQVSAQEFGSRRVWTQVVLQALSEAGLLDVMEYANASAKLVGMEYVATRFDSVTMLSALRLADWSPTRTPAFQMLAIFSNPAGDLRSLSRIFVGFVILLFREPILPEIRSSVTCAALDAFAQREGSVQFLKKLRQQMSGLFGINTIGRVQFEECFDRWSASRDKKLIVVPSLSLEM